jgi:hypothetical protein
MDLPLSSNSAVDCHRKSRTRLQQCLWGDLLMTNWKTGMECVMKTESPMQPSSLQNWCPLGIQLRFSGHHRRFRLLHHKLHLCCCHCHLYPVSWLWSQWMLMQFGGGQLTCKPVTGVDNQAVVYSPPPVLVDFCADSTDTVKKKVKKKSTESVWTPH